jgi:GTP-binding protein
MLEEVIALHPPGMHRTKKRIKIYYLTQVRVAPPSFLLFCNYPESIHFSYKRFLENRLRESFDFGGSPIRLVFRKREEKASHRARSRRRSN